MPSATLRVEYRAEDRVYFPTAPAGIWRGQLGAALRRAAQARPASEEASPYAQLFRKPRSAVRIPDRPARILGPVGLAGEHVPHPFTLRIAPADHRTAPLRLAPGASTTVCLELVGTAIRHLPALVAALDGLGQGGLGRAVSQPKGADRRGTLRLRGAHLQTGRVSLQVYNGRTWRLPERCAPELYEQADGLLEPAVPEQREDPSSLRVRFDTPVRLTYEGTAIDDPSSLSAPALAHACYRRWAALSLCYAPDPPSTKTLDAAYEQVQGLGRHVQIAKRDLDPVERARYSARREKTFHRQGLRGTIRLAGPPRHLAQWNRWLRAVAPLHLGKDTSMGFGYVTVGV
ncbi:MAG: CRISPR system precrRNA processing endoribonuclease RAMP protein Cas6 [Salinibacter sp.]